MVQLSVEQISVFPSTFSRQLRGQLWSGKHPNVRQKRTMLLLTRPPHAAWRDECAPKPPTLPCLSLSPSLPPSSSVARLVQIRAGWRGRHPKVGPNVNREAGGTKVDFGITQLLRRNVRRFQGGLVFKADRLLYHSTLGSRVTKKKGEEQEEAPESRAEYLEGDPQPVGPARLGVGRLGFGVWGLGFGVLGLVVLVGFWGLGFGVWGVGFGVEG